MQTNFIARSLASDSKKRSWRGSDELGDVDLLEVGRRAADVVPADLAVVEVADVRAPEDALEALDGEGRRLGGGRPRVRRRVELVQVVQRVARQQLALQLVRLDDGLRAARHLQLIRLDYAGREAAHATLTLRRALRRRRLLLLV